MAVRQRRRRRRRRRRRQRSRIFQCELATLQLSTARDVNDRNDDAASSSCRNEPRSRLRHAHATCRMRYIEVSKYIPSLDIYKYMCVDNGSVAHAKRASVGVFNVCAAWGEAKNKMDFSSLERILFPLSPVWRCWRSGRCACATVRVCVCVCVWRWRHTRRGSLSDVLCIVFV